MAFDIYVVVFLVKNTNGEVIYERQLGETVGLVYQLVSLSLPETARNHHSFAIG